MFQTYDYLSDQQIKSFRYEYRWADGVQIKKPIEVSAPKYVEYLMDWIESQLDDESLFPQKLGSNFSLVLKLHANSKLRQGRYPLFICQVQ